MTFFWRAHDTVDRLALLPGVRGLLGRRYERRFAQNRGSNLFRGVFETFEAAASSSPETRPLGYDNPASASLYEERSRQLYATDYPVLFWLQQLFDRGCRSVMDLGGHVGVSYYAYRRVLRCPQDLRWRVHDVPAVMAHGRTIAQQKDPEGRLGFSDRFEEADGLDVLLAMGSLQYLPDTLADRLSRLAAPPRHLLLNLTPLHERQSFFTLQSVGTAFCPYRIAAIGPFLDSLASLGYAVEDRWENPEKRCVIPFHPDRSLDRYHGFYLHRAA